MITLTNYDSGEILLLGEGSELRLPREEANRLIMAARMHTVTEFIEKLPSLISIPAFLEPIQKAFEKETSTERWTVKEKFARLQTITKTYQSPRPDQVIDTVTF